MLPAVDLVVSVTIKDVPKWTAPLWIFHFIIPGSYCPHKATPWLLPCPPGYDTDCPGQKECKSCNGTSHCKGAMLNPWEGGGRVRSSEFGAVSCRPGTYRNSEESPDCLLCPLGYYCPWGTAVRCPAGTYGAKEGLQRERDCSVCPAGASDPGWPCARGKFCPAGTMKEMNCPGGTYTRQQGAASLNECLKCPAGFYCPEETSDPLPCPRGTFNPLQGQDDAMDCRLCYAGKACSQMALPQPDVDCMEGFTCPPGSSRPNALENACPPGTFSNLNNLTDRSQCGLCPPRHACVRGTGGIQRPPVSCFAGHYCPRGTMFPTQHKCAAGTWSDQTNLVSASECSPCPRGWYCLTGAGLPSGRCSSGHYCPEGTQFGSQFPCPAGTYSTRMGNGQKDDCRVCPEGSYCTEGSAKPTPCPVATYRREEGGKAAEDCTPCPAGYHCPRFATIKPRACGTGSYSLQCIESVSPSGAADPGWPCARGKFCPAGTMKEMNCPGGTYTRQQGAASLNECLKCPAGFYCPEGTSDPLPCPRGTFNPLQGQDDAMDCRLCYAGKACSQMALPQPDVDCMEGFTCPPGSSRPNALENACPPGTFSNLNNLTDRSQCGLCPPRHACVRGYYCPWGTAVRCPAGTYGAKEGLQRERDCSVCPAGAADPGWPCARGKFCPAGTMKEMNCPGGTYTRQQGAASLNECLKCPAGFYCPEGTSDPLPCPRGTFNPLQGQDDAMDCRLCYAGKACSQMALPQPDVDCMEGFTCPPGSSRPNALENACPPGTFSNLNNLTDRSQCGLCPPRHACVRGTQFGSQFPCPAGTYSTRMGNGQKDDCRVCPEGSYCTEGSAKPTPCPVNETTSQEAMLSLMVCPAGLICTEGLDREPQRATTLCPKGYYCPGGDIDPNPRPCPNGTYSERQGLREVSDCTPCPAGQHCYSESQGISWPTGHCPSGYHCPVGTGYPYSFPCTPGSYRNSSLGHRGEMCQPCPAGFYCTSEATEIPTVCPRGYFCVEGSSSPEPCEEGTYSARPALGAGSECAPCVGGWYCAGTGLTEPTGSCEAGFYCRERARSATPADGHTGGLCPIGSYCPAGSAFPLPCPPGTFSNATGLSRPGLCVDCTPGYHCSGSNISAPAGLCSPGYYCTGGASAPNQHETQEGHYTLLGAFTPEPCALGTFQPSSCLECLRGQFCNQTGLVRPFPCPPGHFCLPGTIAPTPCPAGSYTAREGAGDTGQCVLCDPGQFCSTAGLSARQWTGYRVTGALKVTIAPKARCCPCPAQTVLTPTSQSVQLCPEGHYCPGGTGLDLLPCPPGTYSLEPGNSQLEQCQLCPAGSEGAGGPCPVSHYCPGGSAQPLPCPAGTYNNLTGQAKCFQCGAGYYCPEKTSTYSDFPCPPGFYCPDGTRYATQFPCPRGYYNPEPMTQSLDSCLPCPPGHYCEKERLTTVSGTCKAGWFCVSAAWNSQPFDLDNYTNANCLCPATATGGKCQEGYYCPAGSSEPIPCPPGAYCNGSGLSRPSGSCSAGYYCSGGASQPNPTDKLTGNRCPPGSFCGFGSGDPQPCLPGTFSRVQGLVSESECLPCTEGFYCETAGLVTPSGPCRQGYFCPPGQRVSTGFACPVGHYCPEGSPAPVICESGSYQNLDKQAACKPCEEGYYCDNSLGPVQDPSQYPCPQGHYCPQGTRFATQYGCPVGTFNPRMRVQDVSGCLPCPPGKYCSAIGLAEPTGDCSAGFWCKQGAQTRVPSDGLSGRTCSPGHDCPSGQAGPCPVGHFCPRGTATPQPCPVGTFSNLTKQTSEDGCIPCLPGHFCGSAGLTAPTGECWEGFYCSQGATVPNSPIRDGRGGPCPTGHFCPKTSAAPQPCPGGTYCAVEGQASCSPCVEGYYCPVNSSSYAGTECAPGHYCPTGTSSWNQFPCPAGTYNPFSRGASVQDCIPCDPGMIWHYYFALAGLHCASPGLPRASGQCAAGHYCVGGALTPHPSNGITGDLCPRGHYCSEGSAVPQPCPPGHYSNTTKNTALSDCLPCPQGTTLGRESPCPTGTFNNRTGLSDVSECVSCPAGEYCSSAGLSQPTGACMTGYYCPVNSSSYAGTECAPGHYCPTGTSSWNQFPCPAGTYNPFSRGASVQDCIPCDPGMIWHYYFALAGLHCASPGLPRASGQCAAGHYCVGGALTPHPSNGITGDLCPRGHYCSEGSAVPQPCPPGHYSNTTKNTALSDCLPCPQGFSCDGQGLSAPSGSCQAGYFCPPGQNSSRPASYTCTAGHMCPQGSSQQSPCPPGTYQDQHGQALCKTCIAGFSCSGTIQTETGLLVGTQNPTPCPKGHYCPPGTTLGRESPCPTGTFNNRTGLSDVSECVSCPAGEYCSSAGLSQPTGACMTGFLCFLGAFSPHPLGDSTGRICTPGFYCPQGTTRMLPCRAGTFSTLEGFSCGADTESSAGAGYYHINRSTTVLNPREGFTGNICPAGHFCPAGSSLPSPCPPGTFLARPGAQLQTECQSCVPGSYCSRWGQSSPERLCPEGWFCPEGSVTGEQSGLFCLQGCSSPSPCPLGSVSDAAGLQSELGCSPCPPGFHCNRTGLTAPTGPCTAGLCLAGYYCSGGAVTPTPLGDSTENTCLIDVFCKIRTPAYIFCVNGSCCNGTKAQTCFGWCSAGPCCDGEGGSDPSGSCSPGWSCLDWTLTSKPCSVPPIKASLNSSEMLLKSAVCCVNFTGGVCPKGFYCPEGSAWPVPCDLGQFCHRSHLSLPTGPCAAGFYCGGGASVPNPTACPPGHYCPQGTPNPLPCPPGSFNPFPGGSTSADCRPCLPGHYCGQHGLAAPSGTCAPGYYCPGGQNSSRPMHYPCSPGHFCTEGSSNHTRCPSGTYQAGWAQSVCEECPAGLYCQGPGVIYPAACPVGSYCPPGSTSANQYLCPPGSYGNRPGLAKASDCSPCDPGMYCMGSGSTRPSGQCSPGFYCTGGSAFPAPGDSVMGDRCRAGFYCPRGSATEQACPAGTFSNRPGLSDSAQCQACSPGHFCTESGQPTVSGPCLAGFYCLEGSRSSTPFLKEFGGVCSPGHFCPNGTALPVPCPTGTYRAESGGRSKGDCRPCPAGSYQGLEGQRQCDPCPPGFYCRPQALHAQGAVIPQPCPAGHFCPRETEFGTQTPCPRGTHSRQLGLTSAGGLCSEGFYCPPGQISSRPAASRCPPGHYCPAGSAAPKPCGIGTFQPREEQGSCDICPAGFYCHPSNESGVVRPEPCPRGYFCPPGTESGTKSPCPRGTIGPQTGASSPAQCQPCPAGMYCAFPGLSEPTGPCHAGFFCSVGASSPNSSEYMVKSDGISFAGNNVCPVGHFCPAGTGYPLPCPAGSFSNSPGLKGADQCEQCPPGYHCHSPGLAHQSQPSPCDAGYVCLEGSATARPTDGLHGYLCPSGFRCPAGAGIEVPCEPGTYSPMPGASVCLPCPAGTMCNSTSTEEPSICPRGPCLPGYYCQGGAVDAVPQGSAVFPKNGPCPLGHYCPAATLTPVPCPLGSIKNTTGGSSLASCLPCPAGHYCASKGLSMPSGHCSAGFYCPSAFTSISPNAFLCPKGHHCPPGSAHAHPCPTGEYQPNPGSDYCIPCRPGFYCEEAIAGDPRPCPPHTYCPAATQVPQLCPNGTFTLADMSGLQEERECLPCPSGKFCRGGKIQGSCAAGFLCLSGSSEFTPGGSELENRTSWFYCPEGTEEPSACPAHTVRASPGASQRDHCLPCPPQYWCKEGDPVLYLCPAGHYCNGLKESDPQITAGPQECPVHTYRADPGAGSRGDCLTCPAGYHCNSTGLTDYVHHPCPPGFWCPGSGSPVLCPAGTMRTEPGSSAVSHCDPCTAGFYCPDPMVTGQPNIHGIPCRASSECPPGAVTEVLCRAGSYCGPQTGAPSACPGGCVFPFYCPPSSSRLLPCDGGFMPVNVSGLRDSLERSCVECRSGTYRPSLESELHCLPCPAGYHCPQGTEHYMSNSCPIGYYCPAGTALAVPCPPGSYGNSTQAKHRGECYPCPADTFNHLFGQKACFPCGSSSFSLPGAASCICRGLNRAFQQSDGSCICRAGYVYYNELDQKRSTGNSDMDCQSEVNERCGPGEVRLASTRECVLPGGYDCTAACGSQGGNLSVELGICHCAEYVSAEELCNASCLSKMPKITASLGPNGQLVLNIKDREARGTRDKHVVDTLGPEQYSPAGGSVHIVQFAPEGVFGLIVKERRLLDVFLSGESTSPEVTETPNTLSRNRRSSEHAAAAARIPNPIACLKPSDMIIFQLSLNHRNRSLSHFPVYQKDHLFNSNPGWDSGAFRRLGHLVKETRFNFSRFAHVFSEPGKYVLLDNAAQERSLVVVVSEHHTECESRSFQPSSPGHLVRHGVLKQRQLNLVPNWGAIAGVLGLLALAVAVLTASALVLKPIHAGLSPWRSWKPKWRSLGEPCIPPGYIFTRDSLECYDTLACRGEGEGAETEEESAVFKAGKRPGEMELEDFNVRTLYDKLEDQNLHLAAQLAKHRSEMLDFYKSICQQTEALKEMMACMDPARLAVIEKKWVLLETSGLIKRIEDHETSSPTNDMQTESCSSTHLLEALLRGVEGLLFRMSSENLSIRREAAQRHCGIADCSGLSVPSHLEMDTGRAKDRIRNGSASHTTVRYTFDKPFLVSPVILECVGLAGQQLQVPDASSRSLSEQELAGLITATPLSSTLQQILESLRDRHAQEQGRETWDQ
ncbi:UNVERIFIED_CONTAM: hypothetical protein FKN15_065321 [Acipenser sinensis]